MKITVIQPEIFWENKAKNLSLLEELIKPFYYSTDIIVLPEMFTTGFSMNTINMADGIPSETIAWLKQIAIGGNLAICGSYIARVKGNYLNRWAFVSPDMEVIYDKRHLFRMSHEEAFFRPGNKRVIFDFRGTRILPSVCYDLRFPVWLRNKNDYDLLINSANWPETRRSAWKILLRARAIENQCFVAASNRIGTDGNNVRYCGDSVIIDPKGEDLASAQENKVGSISAELDMESLHSFRKDFPVLKDADNFKLFTKK